jgi:uncharacterized protein (TIGR03083 family)
MPTHLTLDDYLGAIADSGAALRMAAAAAGLDAPVPTCPGWDVRELVTHQGMVHRWAAANLRRDRDHRTSDSTAEAATVEDLLGWLSDGIAALLGTLRTTQDDAPAMVFLNDAPPPRRFWARRQAHETTIHSVDAIAARLGRWPGAADVVIPAGLAADGIDELLCGFITRSKGRLRSTEPFTIVVTAEDTGHAWSVRVSDEPAVTTVGAADHPDAVLAGTAVQLYLGLWNRSDEIAARGREDLLDLWREQVRVQWR